MKRKSLFHLMIISMLALALFSGMYARGFAAQTQNPNKISASTIKSWFTSGVFQGSCLKIPYRQAIIHGEQEGLPALIIYLHGKSAKGNNNTSQLSNKAVQNTASYCFRTNMKAVIVAPQCPKKVNWYDAKMLTTLRELIGLYGNSVDNRRIYIVGDSAGAYGTWAMISTYPQLFAAALPAASLVKGEVHQIQYTPVFVVTGEKDKSAPDKKVRPIVLQLQALGADVRYQVIPKVNHSTCCSNAFSDDNLSWIFSHTLGAAKAGNSLQIKGVTVKISYKGLKKQARVLAPSHVIQFIRYGEGAMTYSKVNGNKKILINNNTGQITLQKGLKKGTYKVKIRALALGDAQHLASLTKTVTFTIKVK